MMCGVESRKIGGRLRVLNVARVCNVITIILCNMCVYVTPRV